MSRQRLPITQRHRKECTRRRDCGCPWSGRVRLPDGTMPRFGGDTWAEAERAYYELKARKPEPMADRATTIAQWAERWQAMSAAQWRPQTRETRACVVRKHIVPELGHYLVTELRRDDVRAWAARKRERGERTRDAVLTLRAMYGAWAESDRVLPYGIPVPRNLVMDPPRKENPPEWTAGQVAALAEAMRSIAPDMALMVDVHAFYGVRTSELRALREEDVTFTGRDMTAPLADQLARLAALPADKYEARKPQLRFDRKLEPDRTVGPMKNARGYRTLPLPQWLAAAFAVQLEKWPPVGGWLFTNWRGRGYSKGYRAASPQPFGKGTYVRWLKKAAEIAGLEFPENRCTHLFRHHRASVLSDKRWSNENIGYWIGDAPQTVSKYYVSPMGDAMDRIAADISGERDTPGLRAV